MSLLVVRIPILLTVLMIATISSAAEVAIPDSTLVTQTAATSVSAMESGADISAFPGSTWGVLLGAIGTQPASADDEDEDEKKRVPKKKIRKKGESTIVSSDDDDQSCLSSCLGDLFISMLMSSDDDEDETDRVEPVSLVAEEAETAYGDTLQERSYARYVNEPAPDKIITPADFSLVLDLSWWKVGPSDVWDEYKDGGGRIGVGGNFIPSGIFEIGVDAGFSFNRGYPLFDYETSTRLESPQSSHLWMFDSGIRVGMIHSLSNKGPFLRWGLGPRVFWVKETADLKVYSLPGPTPLDDRKEALEKWRLGGDFVVSMLWDASNDVLIGFSTRLFIIPWESSGVQSLTLDYIGRKSLVGLNFGLVVHFNGF